MNLDERRLKDIQESKVFYKARLKEDNTDLGVELIKCKIEGLNEEEKDILERCKVKV